MRGKKPVAAVGAEIRCAGIGPDGSRVPQAPRSRSRTPQARLLPGSTSNGGRTTTSQVTPLTAALNAWSTTAQPLSANFLSTGVFNAGNCYAARIRLKGQSNPSPRVLQIIQPQMTMRSWQTSRHPQRSVRSFAFPMVLAFRRLRDLLPVFRPSCLSPFAARRRDYKICRIPREGRLLAAIMRTRGRAPVPQFAAVPHDIDGKLRRVPFQALKSAERSASDNESHLLHG